MKNLEQNAGISAEQAADYARLDGFIEDEQFQQQETEQKEAQQEKSLYDLAADQTVDMLVALVLGYAPKCADIWTLDTKARVSQSLAPVLQKYNVNLSVIPCELILLMTAGPVLYQTAKVIAKQIEDDRVKAAKFAGSGTAEDMPAQPESETA